MNRIMDSFALILMDLPKFRENQQLDQIKEDWERLRSLWDRPEYAREAKEAGEALYLMTVWWHAKRERSRDAFFKLKEKETILSQEAFDFIKALVMRSNRILKRYECELIIEYGLRN